MNPQEYYKDKTVLITGGAGAIGSNLTKELSTLGVKTAIVLDNMAAGYEWNLPKNKNILLVKGSITDDVMLKRVFNEGPSIVFHLAAFFANQNSVDYPEKDLETNGLGTLKLLEYSNLTKVDKFIYGSSGCSIYGKEAPLPLTEEFMSLNLSSPYQITKMLGETYCNFYRAHYGLNTIKARFFNSYGPGEVPGQYRNVIPNFIYWALKETPLPITGDGNQTRDFTYVGDLVNGLLRAGYFDSAIGHEFNLAAGREIKIGDLASMINERTGSSAGIKTIPKRIWDTKTRLLASIDKAKKLIEYEPQTSFEEGLDNAISWFKENWDEIDRSHSFLPGASSAHRE
jgi:nucleoside-diphosphate-sugar epimerase